MRPALTALSIGLVLALATPALAAALSAAEAKKMFFGFDMNGYVEGTDEKWRECIQPNGDTAYWHNGFDRGRLRIRDDGALCFSYASSGYRAQGCYFAHRAGDKWRFVNEDEPDSVFVSTAFRKVNACPGEDAPVS